MSSDKTLPQGFTSKNSSVKGELTKLLKEAKYGTLLVKFYVFEKFSLKTAVYWDLKNRGQ